MLSQVTKKGTKPVPDSKKKVAKTNQPLKKFTCQLCDKSYTQSHSLKSHVRIVHDGLKAEKRYKCPTCREGFTQSHSLKNHIEREHKISSINKTKKVYSFAKDYCDPFFQIS